MKLKNLKIALDTLKDHWDIGLNTDWSKESLHNREKLIETAWQRGQPNFIECVDAIDAYLDISAAIELLERFTDRTYINIPLECDKEVFSTKEK